MDDMPEWVVVLIKSHEDMTAEYKGLRADLGKIMEKIDPITESLSKSPMLKMLGVKL